jgi:hypothetical protein
MYNLFASYFFVGLFIAILLFWRPIFNYFFRAKQFKVEVQLNDLSEYFYQLVRGEVDYIIVELPDTKVFFQFTASPVEVQLDMPLITKRQLSLKPKLLAALRSRNLEPYETEGSDNSVFLDADLRGEPDEIANQVSNIIQDVFNLKSDEMVVVRF